MGRPTKCTPEVVSRICTGLRKGLPRERAARRAGVAESTFHLWMHKATTTRIRKYLEFSEAVHAAEDEWVAKAMGKVTDLLDHEDPKVALQAAKFGLTTRFREDFAQRREQTGAAGGPVAVQLSGHVSTSAIPAEVLAHMSPEQLRALAEGLEVPDGTGEGEP